MDLIANTQLNITHDHLNLIDHMRLHIPSDLHLEFAPFEPSKVDADVIVLAGDIYTGKNAIK